MYRQLENAWTQPFTPVRTTTSHDPEQWSHEGGGSRA